MEYEIKYSKRKSITLKIKDARLNVLAPTGTKPEKIEEIIEKHRHWIASKIKLQEEKCEQLAALTEEDIKRLKREARVYLTEITAYYARLMGAKYNKIVITSAKTRFGSCNSRGTIAYSYRLMLYPEPAREYVVVHELAHTFQMNHSAKFYKIVEDILPDYKARKKLLK